MVDMALRTTVSDQLRENQRKAHSAVKGSRYLLQRLLVCAHCGYAYSGCTNDARSAYYRCGGSDTSRFGGTGLCYNKEVCMDRHYQAVWEEVCRLLEAPEQLEDARQAAAREHRALVERIPVGDAAGARRVMAEHLARVVNEIAQVEHEGMPS